jgi:hypothetical protein
MMESYKFRMINEYRELKEKYDKLHKMLVKYDAGKFDFILTCPIDLLRKQASLMGQYLYVLETRAVIEGVSLNAEDSNDKAESNEAKCDFNYCCCNGAEARIKSETKPDKPKQERIVTRTVSYAKGEEIVYYNILYGFGRQDVLEKLYHYEQEEEEAEEKGKR